MVIEDNNNLVDCCGIRYILENPSGGGFTVSISNNSTTCDNQNAIMADCSNLYVDPFAQGSNSGKSWIDALTNLQDALAIGTNNTIHIAEGTYLPTMQNGLRGKTFLIPTGTTLKGGYPTGGGTQDTEIHETILSGNIDNSSSIQGDSYHVVTLNNVNDVEINSLTIRDGNANDANSFGRSRGGGLYIINSVVELKNVDVKWNKGIRGGGLFASESTVTVRQSTFRNNRADYGGALFYTNASDLKLLRSQVINNSSNNRCALESNNASTVIKNSLIANNTSANANALGIIATNRNVTVEILSSTILGETKNKNLITYQVGNNDQLDVTINNSIIAHQNPNFNKNMVAYNFNILNLNHSNSYFSGSSTIGNGTNALYADMAGDLLLNADYTLDECSPAINAGIDALGTGSQDYFGNPRYFNTIDIGAYEAQTICITPREMASQNSEELKVSLFPNPVRDDFRLQITGEEKLSVSIYDALSRKIYQGGIQHELTIKTEDWSNGIYHLILLDTSGSIRGHQKMVKR